MGRGKKKKEREKPFWYNTPRAYTVTGNLSRRPPPGIQVNASLRSAREISTYFIRIYIYTVCTYVIIYIVYVHFVFSCFSSTRPMDVYFRRGQPGSRGPRAIVIRITYYKYVGIYLPRALSLIRDVPSSEFVKINKMSFAPNTNFS